MSFLDELGAFLESVRAGEVADVPLSQGAIARHRRQLETWFEEGSGAPGVRPHETVSAYSRWLRRCDEGLLELLYDHVARAFPSPPIPLAELVDGALAELVSTDEDVANVSPSPAVAQLSPVRHRTLTHVAHDAAAAFKRHAAYGSPAFRRTCELLRLTRRRERALEPTPAGELLLQLSRRERIRWLLALELASHHGPDEQARVGPAVARKLVERGLLGLDGWSAVFRSPLAQPKEYDSAAALGRWVALGVLTHRVVDVQTGEEVRDGDRPQIPPDDVYSLTDLGRVLLEDLLSDAPHPLMELARAMLEDEDAGLPPDFRWPVVAQKGVVQGLSRYTRTLTHEVRNALIPVQLASQHVARRLQGTELEEPTRRHLATVEAGLLRIFEFVDGWRRVMERAEEAAEPFLVVPAVRAAIAAMRHECEKAVDLRVGESADGTSVKGKRDPFTQALVELIRNAVQVCGPGVSIAIAVERDLERIVIEVSDDGPGVASEHRERIFERGFTTRPGGTGHGLTEAREIVREMSGDLRLTESPDGGVRFVITLPIYTGEAS